MRSFGFIFFAACFLAAFLAGVLFSLSGCASPKAGISPKNKARIESWWLLYRKHDPQWPQAMEKWLALGRRERLCLMDNFLLDIRRTAFRSRRTAAGDLEAGWLKPARDFCKVGGEAVPYLTEALKKLKEEPVIDACVYILDRVARFEDIRPLLADPKAGDSFLSALTRVLGGLHDPRSVGVLAGILSGPYGWRVRASAAEALGECGFFDLDEALKALKKAKGDADPLVAKMSRGALEKLEGVKPVPASAREERKGGDGPFSGDDRQ